MPTLSTASLAYKYFPYFKWSVYSLLAVNIVLFFMHETVAEGIDSLAWVTLLMLFEYETSQMDKPYVSNLEKYSIHAGRLLSYTFILYAAYEYSTPEFIAEEGYVDLYNAITWLAVVAALEYDVYAPGYYGRAEWAIRNTFKVLLYAALIVYAIMWGFEGKLLDFYDAFLWIVCFFCIELNVFKFEDEQPYEEEVLEAEAAQGNTEQKGV